MNDNKSIWENIYRSDLSNLKYPDSNLVSLFFNIKSAIPSDKKYLDFGCGSGNNAEFLLNHFKEVYAVDISDSAIELTRKRLGKENDKYNLNFNTKLDDNFKNFDLVVAWQSLSYNSKESFLVSFKKLIDCLKPNGIIIFTLIDVKDIKVKNSNQLNQFDYKINSNIKTQENCTIFAIDSYEQLLELLSGFSIDIVDYGQFGRYSREISGIQEYYIIAKKYE
jgi:2-polyprenyl-3-methyl-5-hydroxy-6-metoxy-1,4-benzoquinol methylase